MSWSSKRTRKLSTCKEIILPIVLMYAFLWLQFLPFPQEVQPYIPNGIWLWMGMMATLSRSVLQLWICILCLCFVDVLLYQPLCWHGIWFALLTSVMCLMKKKRQQWMLSQVEFISGLAFVLLYWISDGSRELFLQFKTCLPLLITLILWLTWVYHRFAYTRTVDA